MADSTNLTRPVWTEPYIDAFGFGRMVTVSMPVYLTDGGSVRVIGVTGIDVVMGQLTSFGLNE